MVKELLEKKNSKKNILNEAKSLFVEDENNYVGPYDRDFNKVEKIADSIADMSPLETYTDEELKKVHRFLENVFDDMSYNGPVGTPPDSIVRLCDKIIDLNNQKISKSYQFLKYFLKFYNGYILEHQRYKKDDLFSQTFSKIVEKSTSPDANFLIGLYIRSEFNRINKNDESLFDDWEGYEIVGSDYYSIAAPGVFKYSDLYSEEKLFLISDIKNYDLCRKKIGELKKIEEDFPDTNTTERTFSFSREGSVGKKSKAYRRQQALREKAMKMSNELKSYFHEWNINDLLKNKDETFAQIFAMFMNNEQLKNTIENFLGFKINQLPIKTQVYVLEYFFSITNEVSEKFEVFTKKYGMPGFSTFLSIEHDKSLGDKIIELGNRLPEDVAKKIFAKYAELTDLTDSVAQYVQQFQKDHKEPHVSENKEDSVQQISEKLLVRAKDILVHSIDKSPEEILAMLDSVKADAELFKSTFSIEKKRGNTIPLENIRDAQFENKKSSELVEEEKTAMRDLYRKNYASNPPFQKVLLESFENALQNPSTTFYLFKLKGEIKGFDRFDDVGNGQKYFGSFNVDESMQGATLGESMIDQSVNVEAKEAEIIADCHAANRIGARYIENGFVATSFTENYYGVPAFSIIRNDPETSQLFKTKLMTTEDLESLVTHPRNDIRVYEALHQEDLLPLFNEKVGHGHVLTRYFQNQDSKKWFAVLEVLKQ